MDAVERSKVRGARDMLRECAKQLRSVDATGHAALADMHADQIGGLLPPHCKIGWVNAGHPIPDPHITS